MGTRSFIARPIGLHQIESIYCHWDGYPKHNGDILHNHYPPEKRDALFALGSLSSLAESTDKPAGHSFENPVKGHCVAYGRDRGETDVESLVHGSLKELLESAADSGAEYVYLASGAGWDCASVVYDDAGKSEFKPLALLLKDMKESADEN